MVDEPGASAGNKDVDNATQAHELVCGGMIDGIDEADATGRSAR